jgi:MFS family permease
VPRRPARRILWRHGDFLRLWGGQSVSELGSQVSVLALPLVAIDRLHAGTFAVALLATSQGLPFLLVGLPAGALVDRVRRRPVMIGADVGRALLLASVPATAAAGVLEIWQLYVVGLLVGVLTVFFDVDYQSYLPDLLPAEHLIDANGKLQTTASGASIVGPGIGGTLVSAVGAASAVLVDSGSFVVSALTLASMRHPEARPERRIGGDGRPARLRAEIAEGMRYVWHEPRIRPVALSTGTSNLFSGMSAAVVVLFLRRQLQLSPGHIGVLLGAGSVGGLLGALLGGRLGRRIGIGRAILVTITIAGLGDLLLPLTTRGNADVVVVASGLLVGAGAIAYNINQVSVRQAICPPALLGRMNASVRFLVWGTIPLGGLLGGAVGSSVGLRPALWVAGVGGSLAFTWVLFSPVRSITTLPTQPAP